MHAADSLIVLYPGGSPGPGLDTEYPVSPNRSVWRSGRYAIDDL